MSNSPETLIVEGKDKVENVNKATSNLADKKTVNSDITHVPTLLTHNISIPFGIVFVVSMLGWLHILPIFIQLLLNSASCVFIGCVLSTKLRINSLGVLENASKQLAEDEDVIDMKQALRFPVTASIFLVGFYLLIKFVDKDIINLLISIFFCVTTIISTSEILEGLLKLPDSMKKVLVHVKTHPYIKKYLQIVDFDVTPASLLCILTCSVPVVLYFVTKHWFLNNIFGVLFTIVALKSINLHSFKVGFTLLWILFFYDIFFVYGTDIMVTVAKNLSIPIKLQFPYLKYAEDGSFTEQFSMVGLGDLVIPGLFISICLKFDVDRFFDKFTAKRVSEMKFTYFRLAFVGYIVGIILTFIVMIIFEAAQPALLYLVPTVSLSVLGLACRNGEIEEAKEYTTGLKKPEVSSQPQKADGTPTDKKTE